MKKVLQIIRVSLIVVAVILFAAFAGASVHAQDATDIVAPEVTETPTAEATATVAPIVTPAPETPVPPVDPDTQAGDYIIEAIKWIGLFAVGAAVLYFQYNSVPAAYWTAEQARIDAARTAAATTPTLTDDVVTEVRQLVLNILKSSLESRTTEPVAEGKG